MAGLCQSWYTLPLCSSEVGIWLPFEQKAQEEHSWELANECWCPFWKSCLGTWALSLPFVSGWCYVRNPAWGWKTTEGKENRRGVNSWLLKLLSHLKARGPFALRLLKETINILVVSLFDFPLCAAQSVPDWHIILQDSALNLTSSGRSSWNLQVNTFDNTLLSL